MWLLFIREYIIFSIQYGHDVLSVSCISPLTAIYFRPPPPKPKRLNGESGVLCAVRMLIMFKNLFFFKIQQIQSTLKVARTHPARYSLLFCFGIRGCRIFLLFFLLEQTFCVVAMPRGKVQRAYPICGKSFCTRRCEHVQKCMNKLEVRRQRK